MPILHHDFETRSTLNLKKVGAWRYATCPTTDVWCCAYAVDDGPIELWIPGDPVPQPFTDAANNPDWIVCAFNDQFERLITQHIMVPRHGWPLIPIEHRRCLQASAQAHALPGSLEKASPALGLEERKDHTGHNTMMQMARPRKRRKGEDPNGIYWFDDLDRRLKLYAYCKQDTAVERAIHARIGFLSDEEQKLWVLDATINDRGIHIDRTLLTNARKIAEQEQHEIDIEITQLTGGEITSIDQLPRFPKWFAGQGCALDNNQKETLEQALKRTDLAPRVRRVIELRLAGAHAAAAKHGSMLAWINPDDRARGALRFHGASTGRWTSHGIQLQNMKRPLVEDMGAAIKAVNTGSLEHMRTIYKQPMSVVGDISRAMICAAQGHRFIAADFSGVESRITAWLSGQQSKVDQWAKFDQTGNPEDEPYYITGFRIFGINDADRARIVGKTGDLAFGYMGGIGAWRKMAKLVLPDDTSTDAEIKRRQQAWRDAHPLTVMFWNALNYRAVKAVQNPGTTIQCKRVSFSCDGSFLRMALPSGRTLSYPFPKLGKDKFDKPTVVFLDSTKGKWAECRGGEGAYGGIWIENAVQAVARDLFAAAMQPLENAGYKIVLHVHDEIVVEVPEGFGSEQEFLKILTTPPSWADGLPIAAKVRSGPRFCKSEKKPKSAEAAPEQVAPEEPPADTAGDAPFEDTMHGNFKGEHRDSRGWGERHQGRVKAEYIYKRPNGEPYLLVKRMEPKSFPQFHMNGSGCWEKGAPKGPKIPYRLPELVQASSQEPVFICEGEKDANSVADLGLIATCNSGGAKKWTPDLNPWFNGKKVAYIPEDNDDVGRTHAHEVAAHLAGIVSEIRIISFPDVPEGEDVSYWLNELGHSKTELIERATAAPVAAAATFGPTLRSARLSSFILEGLEWIWPDRFAVGKLGIIAGLPDEGKGQILCDIAARITRGLAWPCGEGIAPKGNVILLTAEDAISDTVYPRMMAAGADPDHIEIVQMTVEAGKDRMFSLVTDLALLRQKVIDVGDVRMIQIDPISAYLGVGKIDSFRTTDVRAVLGPMVELTTELKVGALGVMHFNKKTDVTNALLRISDSLAFGATARHVYAAVNDAENARKVFVKGKNNLARFDQKALSYTFGTRVVGTDQKTGKIIEAPHVIWGDEHVDVTAAEAMAAATDGKSLGACDKAKVFLEDLLANNPTESTEVEEAAKANDISMPTLRRAKAKLKIKALKDGPMKDGQRTWRWHLPKKEKSE